MLRPTDIAAGIGPTGVLGRFLRGLGSPAGAVAVAAVGGVYWGVLFTDARSLERREGPAIDTRELARDDGAGNASAAAKLFTPNTPTTLGVDRTPDGWRVSTPFPGRTPDYTVTDLHAPARHTWLAAPIRREREIDVRWFPRPGDSASTGSEVERREALAALAAWLEDPANAGDVESARFLRQHPDGRSSEVLIGGYVHTCVLGTLGAMLVFSLAGSPRWIVRARRAARERTALARGTCVRCGYCVQALPEATCPECGETDTVPARRAHAT